MPDIHIVPAAAVESLRRKAKQLKKQERIPHHEALDMVARKSGIFANWHHLVEAAKATEPTERAFTHGFVAGLDPKDFDNHGRFTLDTFVQDDGLLSFVLDELNSEMRKNLDAYEIEEYEELVYLRCKHKEPADLDKAMDFCVEHFPSPPRYFRFNGQVIEAIPQNDEDE